MPDLPNLSTVLPSHLPVKPKTFIPSRSSTASEGEHDLAPMLARMVARDPYIIEEIFLRE